MINWHLEKRNVSELKNWKKNPRTITPEALKELKESVETLGNFEPLVINIDGTVVAGNQRLKLEIEKGAKEIDVYVPERELTETEISKIGIVSNRHSGEWDTELLLSDFSDILNDLGFDDLLPKTTEPKEIDHQQQFQIVVECESENEQERIFTELTEQGYQCKPLIF